MDNMSLYERVWVSLGFAALVITTLLYLAAREDGRMVRETGEGEPYRTLALRWQWVDAFLVFWQVILLTAGLISAAAPEPIRDVLRERDAIVAGLFMTMQISMVICPIGLFKFRRFLAGYDFRATERGERQ